MKRNKNVFQQFKYAAAILLGMFFPGIAGFAQNAGILVEPLFGCQYGTLYEYVFANYGTSAVESESVITLLDGSSLRRRKARMGWAHVGADTSVGFGSS